MRMETVQYRFVEVKDRLVIRVDETNAPENVHLHWADCIRILGTQGWTLRARLPRISVDDSEGFTLVFSRVLPLIPPLPAKSE